MACAIHWRDPRNASGLCPVSAVQADAAQHPRHADANALVLLVLMGAQKDIAVVDHAVERQHIQRAQTTFATPAIGQGADPGQLQGVKQAFVRGDCDVNALARDLQPKGLRR